MTRKRLALTVVASLAGLTLVALGAAVLILQSSWFYEKVRHGIVTTVADATGGRVSIGGFHFDWKHMRAEVTSLQIAGKEPAGKPALFRADSIVVGFKIVSLLKHDVDIQSLEVRNPRVYLIVYPDGSTNMPEPKVKRAGGQTMETILKLAVGRFHLQNGIFEIESQGKTPFDARGQNLNAALQFEPAGPRYRGEISVQQLDIGGTDYRGVWSATAAVAFEKDRISVTSARLSTGNSVVQLAGALDNLAAPRAQFQFDARVAAADAGRALHIKLLERGTAELAGTARWTGGSQFSLDGKLHAYNLDYRGAYVQLRGFRADGVVSASQAGIALSTVRLSGNAANIDVAGQVANISFRAGDLGFQGIALGALGGMFRGEVRVRDFERFSVSGEIAGVEARRTVSLYSSQALPWNSRVGGKVHAEGLLQRKNALRANADLVLEPAPDSAPVHGQISGSYDTGTGALDFGRCSVMLPSSRAEFSGALGQQLRVHLETRDLNDLLPLLGGRTASLPVKLENGAVLFDGTVTGKLDDLKAAGHLTARNFLYSGEKVDSLSADVTASAQNAAMRNAALVRGSLHAQFEAAVDLHGWKADGSSLIAGSGSFRNASLADIAAMLKAKQTPVRGTLAASAQINGTVGSPIVKADITASKGALLEEPFDQVTAHVDASGRSIVVSNAQLTAGAKQVRFSAGYDHAPDSLETGHLRFQIDSNSMPLEAIENIHRDRPDAKGTVQITAHGALELAVGKAGDLEIRVSDLHGDMTARGLRVAEQALGDAHLTASTQGQLLRAHLDSDFAGSTIKGDGEWKLEGDYPGSATIAFSRIDLARLRAWLSPEASGISETFAGWAEGQLRLDGPALKPEAMKAQLRIPNFEIGASSVSAAAASLTLHNSGPIVASMSNSVISVDSMRLVGHDSDLGVTGKISLRQKTPDLRVNGRVDLAIVHDFNPDFRATGTVTADATVRGTLAAPVVSGRTEFHNAAFQVADLPNGLSSANGVILFSGNRATIQSFSGETGGGKVELSGFAGFGGGQTIFRIHARVQEVRVRYPEGVSTVADATLNLTGAPDRSMLAGTVTILRTGFNPQSDFSSLIAQSAQPVRTASARAGFLGGLSFDIQINTAPDIEFQSSLAQDLQVEANLRLRGTFSNPALLGRVNLTQGQIVFFGTRYTINQGSISFFNPIRVEPVFDIDLETKARGIDITLAVTGPLNKLNLTPLSDPPLQFNEIVALLATGRTPTNDPAQLSQQAAAPQSWQQMGASALLGQAIASPVAGRLQRFFGVSKLRIDPSLPGVESSPQARLTLEQQVTSDITFTYITNVTSSNPQVIRVEWAFSKQWSVVAVRDENGMFGIDFLYKRRF
jgi:translocation and assembly module TamB